MSKRFKALPFHEDNDNNDHVTSNNEGGVKDFIRIWSKKKLVVKKVAQLYKTAPDNSLNQLARIAQSSLW